MNMTPIRIVTDSSANLLPTADARLTVAPLKILTDEREFTDNADLDIPAMLTYMEQYKGRSQTSCPNASDWLAAFGDARDILCVTITSALSGSCNAARSAARIYENDHEGRRVFVLDSLSAGPEMQLVVEAVQAWAKAGMPFEAICQAAQAYLGETELIFMLKSLRNFANNGRVSPSTAKIAGLLGLCVIGRASEEGTLQPVDKCRGEARSFARLLDMMEASGLRAGRVSIAHCQNEAGAAALRERILGRFPLAEVTILPCLGLCSYYVEAGGILIGFEKR